MAKHNAPNIRLGKAPLFLVPIVILVVIAFQSFQIVPAGHVGVAALFGEIVKAPYEEGMHFPVNPLYKWAIYDARMKSHNESADVPSQDQLTSKIDVSVQWRLTKAQAPEVLKDTGTAEQMVLVHMIPKLRSLLREQGKTIPRAEDLFLEETQRTLQASLTLGLQEYLTEKGITVEQVLIRDIQLPPFIVRAIESKKEREQEVEKQKAELERFRTEQEQLVAEAQAMRQAAEEESQMIRVLAEAKAFEIEQINDAIKENPAYIQLQALKTLAEISKDPASKLYFMDGNAPMPLPLMNLGGN